MLNLAVIDTDYLYRSKHREIVTMVVPRGGRKIQRGCTAVSDEYTLSMHLNFVSFGIILSLHYRPFTPQLFAEPDALCSFCYVFFFSFFFFFFCFLILILNVPDENYSRNVSCALILRYRFL